MAAKAKKRQRRSKKVVGKKMPKSLSKGRGSPGKRKAYASVGGPNKKAKSTTKIKGCVNDPYWNMEKLLKDKDFMNRAQVFVRNYGPTKNRSPVFTKTTNQSELAKRLANFTKYSASKHHPILTCDADLMQLVRFELGQYYGMDVNSKDPKKDVIIMYITLQTGRSIAKALNQANSSLQSRLKTAVIDHLKGNELLVQAAKPAAEPTGKGKAKPVARRVKEGALLDMEEVKMCLAHTMDPENPEHVEKFAWYILTLLSKAALQEAFDHQIHCFQTISEAQYESVHDGDKMVFSVPYPLEAHAAVVYESCMPKWIVQAHNSADGIKEKDLTDDQKPPEALYTTKNGGQAMYGCWKTKGIQKFQEYRNACKSWQEVRELCCIGACWYAFFEAEKWIHTGNLQEGAGLQEEDEAWQTRGPRIRG